MSRIARPFAELFWPKVNKGSADDCWLWRGAVSPGGYGRFKVGRVNSYAHRIAYERFVGPIPAGWHVDHLCETKACVNPFHLEAVTPAENQRRTREMNEAVA